MIFSRIVARCHCGPEKTQLGLLDCESCSSGVGSGRRVSMLLGRRPCFGMGLMLWMFVHCCIWDIWLFHACVLVSLLMMCLGMQLKVLISPPTLAYRPSEQASEGTHPCLQAVELQSLCELFITVNDIALLHRYADRNSSFKICFSNVQLENSIILEKVSLRWCPATGLHKRHVL